MKKPKKDFDPRLQCITQFKKWWTKEDLREKIIPLVSSSHMFDLIKDIKGIDKDVINHDLLANVLYDIVGSKFLRKISNKGKINQKFRKEILDAAINSGNASKDKIFKIASRYEKTKIESTKTVSEINAHSKWLRELATELELPSSVIEKQFSEKKDPSEIVIPHSPQNPLYDYQYATGMEILDMLKGKSPHKRRLISIPTGAGKTRLVVETMIDWINLGQPGNEQQHNSKFMIWVAQSNELCEQAYSTFKTIFEDKGRHGTTLHLHRFWGSDNKSSFYENNDSILEEKGIIIASINSLYSAGKNQPEILDSLGDMTSCIVIDEAHHSTSKMYTSVLNNMGFNFRKSEPSEKEIILIGLTATPFRGTGTKKDGSGLNDETKRLRERYGSLLFPEIDEGEGVQNTAPIPIIDSPAIGRVGYPFRISGERSYDKDGNIEKFSWTVIKQPTFSELMSKEKTIKDNCVIRKIPDSDESQITFTPTSSGEYKIKLTVEDNEGEIGHTQTYFRIKDQMEDESGTNEIELQKKLYRRLMKRKILCQVYHEEIPMSRQILSNKQAKELRTYNEYKSETLDFLAKNKERNKKILESIKKTKDRGRKKILFFACSVEHAQTISLVLGSCYNMKSGYVTGEMDIDERISVINSFKEGKLDVLCNFNVLTTGFDAPGIDCVFVGRPARSTLLYTQMIGRGMRGIRSHGTEDVLIIDIDDNFQVHFQNDEDEDDMLVLGWQLFKDFWKPWHTHKSITGGRKLTDELTTLECSRCKNHAVGIEAIQKVFQPSGEPSGIVESLLNGCLDLLPKECLKCRLESFNEEPGILIKKCPQCNVQSKGRIDIETIFGFRKTGGKIIPQSYCRSCRSKVRKGELKCPYVNFLKNQGRIHGNYQMILGLYLIESQKNSGKLCPANITDARRFLLKHNLDKKPIQIGTNHPVFQVYKNHGLIQSIDSVTGEIAFVPILDMVRFGKLCYDKLKEHSLKHPTYETIQEETNSIQELVVIYQKIRKTLFKHPPTQRQFAKSLPNYKLLDVMKRTYGSYHNFLESQGETIHHNLDLEDILFDEYFELRDKLNRGPTKDELDGYGDYTISDYVECFDSYESFQNAADEITFTISEIKEDVTINELQSDYTELKTALGHIPHFSEIKNKSKYGIEHYLKKFVSYGKFSRIMENKEGVEHIMIKLKEDYDKIKKLLGIPLNLTQMMRHSNYGGKILDVFEKYSDFLNYIQEHEKPIETISGKIVKENQEKLLRKFNTDIKLLGKTKTFENLIKDNPIPYNEWFSSKESFVKKLSNDVDGDWRFEKLYKNALKKKSKEQSIQTTQEKTKIPQNKVRNWWKSCPKCGSGLEKFGKHNIQCSNSSCNYTR